MIDCLITVPRLLLTKFSKTLCLAAYQNFKATNLLTNKLATITLI